MDLMKLSVFKEFSSRPCVALSISSVAISDVSKGFKNLDNSQKPKDVHETGTGFLTSDTSVFFPGRLASIAEIVPTAPDKSEKA